MVMPATRSVPDIYIDNIPISLLSEISNLLSFLSATTALDDIILTIFESKDDFINRLIRGPYGWRGEWGLPQDPYHAHYNKTVGEAEKFWQEMLRQVCSPHPARISLLA